VQNLRCLVSFPDHSGSDVRVDRTPAALPASGPSASPEAFHPSPRGQSVPCPVVARHQVPAKELFPNRFSGIAAIDELTGAKRLITVPNITHFHMYIDAALETSSNAAVEWFLEHL
jgi:hypothetical protein